jgi:hypothetical protein
VSDTVKFDYVAETAFLAETVDGAEVLVNKAPLGTKTVYVTDSGDVYDQELTGTLLVPTGLVFDIRFFQTALAQERAKAQGAPDAPPSLEPIAENQRPGFVPPEPAEEVNSDQTDHPTVEEVVGEEDAGEDDADRA